MFFKFKILLFACISLSVTAQNIKLSEKAKVSVLTCGTSDELHSLFGHTALRIQDDSLGIDLTYNFGMFNFETPNFYLKFVKGDLEYQLAIEPFNDFMFHYQYTNRSVWEQELLLKKADKQQIFDRLNRMAQSDERYYVYKFIDQNCTTRVVDVINPYITPQLTYPNAERKTYKMVLYDYFTHHYYEKLGINILFGLKTDALVTHIFLPMDLLTQLEKHSVSFQTDQLYKQRYSNYSNPWWNTPYTLMVLLGIALFVNKTIVDNIVLSLFGLLGLFLIGLTFYSLHQELLFNYNILLFNPLLIIMVGLRTAKYYTALLWVSMITFVGWLLYVLYSVWATPYGLMLPLMVTVLILIIRNIFYSRRQLNLVK